MKEPRRLGRGLSTIVSPAAVGGAAPEGELAAGTAAQRAMLRGLSPSTRLLSIRLDQIRQNPMQPRRDFDEAALQGLAASIREHGTLQPVVARQAGDGFELVAGERRLRAARLAGLTEIPAVIRAASDQQLLELALVENIQRQDLNPLDRARAYQSLNQLYGLSHEAIAERVGDDRATVTNYLRLLGLPDRVKDLLAAGHITAGHARAIAGLSDPHIQIKIAEAAAREAWSVRRLEGAIARREWEPRPVGRPREARATVTDLEQRLQLALGTKVTIHEGRRRHTGRIVIEYYSLNDFDRLLVRLGEAGEGA